MFKFLILCCTLMVTVYGMSVKVGQTQEGNGVKRVYQKDAKANGFLGIKRVETINIENTDVIKGITITDLDNGLAEPAISMGGLGFKFADIKLKSLRGQGYNFRIEIYA